mmetsp:Transcript_99767/g.311474  ORF Transcript_99767/g.311474 Transcript_99767/m.311474 type:complete len:224 (-) Transcript_99767:28-699(-)
MAKPSMHMSPSTSAPQPSPESPPAPAGEQGGGVHGAGGRLDTAGMQGAAGPPPHSCPPGPATGAWNACLASIACRAMGRRSPTTQAGWTWSLRMSARDSHRTPRTSHTLSCHPSTLAIGTSRPCTTGSNRRSNGSETTANAWTQAALGTRSSRRRAAWYFRPATCRTMPSRFPAANLTLVVDQRMQDPTLQQSTWSPKNFWASSALAAILADMGGRCRATWLK